MDDFGSHFSTGTHLYGVMNIKYTAKTMQKRILQNTLKKVDIASFYFYFFKVLLR